MIDEGTFDNVLISYPVYEKSTFPDEFDAIVNWLASLQGYQRIECSNDPNHFRLGRFVVPQTPTAKRLNKDGYYTLTFDCKPQRWLLSGEEDTEITANPATEYTGDVVTFTANALDEITGLSVAINPIQSGTGDPAPDNIRPITGWSAAEVVRTGKNLLSGIYAGQISSSTGQESTGTLPICAPIKVKPSTAYTLSPTATNGAVRFFEYDANGNFTKTATASGTAITGGYKVTYTTSATTAYLRFQSTATIVPFDGAYQLEESSSATTYEAFGTTYLVDWASEAGTVYGGTLNVTTGVLTIDRGFATFDGSSDESWTVGSANAAIDISDMPSGSNMSGLSNMYVVGSSAGQLRLGNNNKKLYLVSIVSTQGITSLAQLQTFLSGSPLQVVYPLATPTTVQLTATEVKTLLGVNNIWADTGDVTVEVTSGTLFNNPSPFNAKPLIRVYGIGTFRINDNVVTIASHDKPYIDIDCELQECYYEGENMSAYVSFSDNDYPVLIPDDNFVLLASGITKLDVTPRWWIL